VKNNNIIQKIHKGNNNNTYIIAPICDRKKEKMDIQNINITEITVTTSLCFTIDMIIEIIENKNTKVNTIDISNIIFTKNEIIIRHNIIGTIIKLFFI
jgi:hypothetical protein